MKAEDFLNQGIVPVKETSSYADMSAESFLGAPEPVERPEIPSFRQGTPPTILERGKRAVTDLFRKETGVGPLTEEDYAAFKPALTLPDTKYPQELLHRDKRKQRIQSLSIDLKGMSKDINRAVLLPKSIGFSANKLTKLKIEIDEIESQAIENRLPQDRYKKYVSMVNEYNEGIKKHDLLISEHTTLTQSKMDKYNEKIKELDYLRTPGYTGKWGKEYGIVGGIKDVGKLIYDIPINTMGAMASMWEDDNPEAEYDWKDIARKAQAVRNEQRASEAGGEEYVLPWIQRKDIREASASSGFSGVAMGAGALGGAAALPIPVPGARVAGALAGSGIAAYNMDKAMFTQQLIDSYRQTVLEDEQRDVTPDEVATLVEKTKDLRSKHALWEAIPEAAGNVAQLSGIGSIFKAALGKNLGIRVFKTLAGMYGAELGTETITQTGQHNVEIEVGLSAGQSRSFASMDDMYESFKEVAPQTFILVSLTGGGGAVAGKTYQIVANPENNTDASEINPVVRKFNNGEIELDQAVEEINASNVSEEAKESATNLLRPEIPTEAKAGLDREGMLNNIKADLESGKITADDVVEFARLPEAEGIVDDLKSLVPDLRPVLNDIISEKVKAEIDEQVKFEAKQQAEIDRITAEEEIEPVIEPAPTEPKTDVALEPVGVGKKQVEFIGMQERVDKTPIPLVNELDTKSTVAYDPAKHEMTNLAEYEKAVAGEKVEGKEVSLFQEAKKYKTAGEFVDAETDYLNKISALEDFPKLKNIITKFKSGEEFSKIYEVASRFSKAPESFTERETELMNEIIRKDIDSINFKKLGEMAGIDFKDKFGKDFFEFVKLRQQSAQLTGIWNKAHAKPQPSKLPKAKPSEAVTGEIKGEAIPEPTPKVEKEKIEVTPEKAKRRKVVIRPSKVRTLRGAIKEMGGINFLNFTGELKNMDTAVKYLSKKTGRPIDLAERELKEDGWLYPGEVLLDVLTDAKVLKRDRISKTALEKPEHELSPEEIRIKKEMKWEPEAPPKGEYVTINAEDLPKGKKLTLIEGKTREGWDVYEVTAKDPFEITLMDGQEITLHPLDKIDVLKEDMEEPKIPKEQIEGFKPKPKLLGGKELIPEVKGAKKEKLAALDKVSRQATSKFEQDSMFEPNQQGLFEKPTGKAKEPAIDVIFAMEDFPKLTKLLPKFKSGEEFSKINEAASRWGKAPSSFSVHEIDLMNDLLRNDVDSINFVKLGKMAGKDFKDKFGKDFFEFWQQRYKAEKAIFKPVIKQITGEKIEKPTGVSEGRAIEYIPSQEKHIKRYVPITRKEADNLFDKGAASLVARFNVRGPETTGEEGYYMRSPDRGESVGYSYSEEVIDLYEKYKERHGGTESGVSITSGKTKQRDGRLPAGVRDEKAFATKATKPQDTITRADLKSIFAKMKNISTGVDKDGNFFFRPLGKPVVTIYEVNHIEGYIDTSKGRIPVGSFLGNTIELKTGGEGHTADVGTAWHEFTHYLEKNGILSGNDIKALNGVIAKSEGISESKVTEEHRATYVGDRLSEWQGQKNLRIKRILKKIADFVNSIWEFVSRTRTARGVLADIETGKILSEKDLSGVNQFAQDVSFSLKKAAKAVTDNPNFVKWFGDTEHHLLAEEDGEPRIMYRGMSQRDFDTGVVDSRKKGAAVAGYFTNLPEGAQQYANRILEGDGVVKEFYVAAENVFNDRELTSLDEAEQKFIEKKTGQTIDDLDNDVLPENKKFIKALKELGYDAIETEGNYPHTEICPFEPTQIKSIYNTGAFGIKEKDIMFQMAGQKAIGAPTGQLVKAQEMLAEEARKYKTVEEFVKSQKGIDETTPNIYWHGSASGDLRGGATGLHVGTKRAATQALEARIGIPADGKGWTGNREYGKTLLAGKETLKRLDPKGYNVTGYNVDVPKNDFYPTKKLKYADRSEMPMTVKPSVNPFRIKGKMTNTPRTPHQDFKAGGYMAAQKKKGKAKSGYFYENVGEDAGSISATVPSGEHLESVKTKFQLTDIWNKAQETKQFATKPTKDYKAMLKKYQEAHVRKPSFQETLEPVTAEDYISNRKVSRNIKLAAVTNAKRVTSEIVGGIDRFLGSISTRLGQVSPKLKAKMRRLDFDINTKYADSVKAVQPLLEKAKKMNRDDFADWDYARKNSDIAKIGELINKYNLQDEYIAYRKTLDSLRKEGLDVGLEIGEIKEYAPRILKDSKGFLTAIGKAEEWPIYSRRLQERAQEIGISVAEMPLDMKADIISNMMLGGWVGLGGIPATKQRKLQKIPAYLNNYYMDSDAALMQHLHSMRKAIEARKFFGKIPKKVAEIRKRLYAAQVKIRELNDRLEDKLSQEESEKLRKKKNGYIGLEKQYTAYIQKYAVQRDYTENIGAYVIELIEKKEISPQHERVVNDILKARFHEVGTRGVIQAYKNLSYIDTMGSPISALTQIGDLAWAAYEGGLIRTLKYAYKSATKQSRITKEDVGVERIAQEFADAGTLGNAVSRVFKIVGLEKIDSIGKEALLNTALEKYQTRAKKEPFKLKREIKPVFENETDSVIDDLVNNEISENVKLLVYSRLLDFQPVGLSEMPQGYLDAGNGRLFYMLKTFTIKVFDVYRNEVYYKVKKGNKAEKIEGFKNLARLSFYFVLANAGADELKDWVLGRTTDFSDRLADNILRLFGVSKFVTWKARTEGVGSALARQVLPPFKFIDSAYKDIITAGDEKGLEVIGSIPVVGKLAYWHLGRGTSKREDLWDRRLRKHKAKLNKIKNDFDKAKDKATFQNKHREELRALRKANELQGELNEYRKRINRIKSRKETKAGKLEIQRLEKRRTAKIKNHLKRY